MSLLFFNVLFIFYYYFKIVDFLYIDLFDFNYLINSFIMNFIVIVVDIFVMFLWTCFKMKRSSYFCYVLLGLVIGVIMSFILLGISSHKLYDYLAFCSYFLINTIFICYSLTFDKNKVKVFA